VCSITARSVLICLFSVSYAASGRAAPIYSIAIAATTIAPNGAAEVAVTITGASDTINLAGYEFRITPTGGATSQLQFIEESETFLTDPAYVFAGNSAAFEDGIPSSVGTVSSSILPSDSFVGGDGANNLADVTVTGQKLLVKLAVKHLAGPADPATTLGHQFEISLVPAAGDSSAFGSGGSNSGFLNSILAGIPFDSQPGAVSVVPESPCAPLTAIVAALLLSCRLPGQTGRLSSTTS
jgi:hypothetical protein